jgi:hypothetical protein
MKRSVAEKGTDAAAEVGDPEVERVELRGNRIEE